MVKKAVFKARRKWRPIGSELGVSEDDLDNIEDEGEDNEECLSNVLRLWLRKRSLHPSWRKLVEALRAEVVGREDIAHKIAEQYLEPTVEGQANLSCRLHFWTPYFQKKVSYGHIIYTRNVVMSSLIPGNVMALYHHL